MSRLCVLDCHNFQLETQASIRAECWQDVVSVGFAARCGRPPIQWEELRAVIPADSTHVVLFGRACLAGLGDPPSDFLPTRVLVQEQCFHLIAGPSLVADALSRGSYLLSPGWLLQWRERLADMGFSEDSAQAFFKDFAKQLVLLDTGVDPQVTEHLTAFESCVGLSAQRLAVGLDHLRALLRDVVLHWQLEELQQAGKARERDHARELADHVSALDLLGRMTKVRTEADVVAAIEDLFRMLFGAEIVQFAPSVPDHRYAVTGLAQALADQIQSLQAPYAWTESGSGFLMRVARDGLTLGCMVVEGLVFAQYRERYLNLALAISDVMALAIESARTRKRLVDAEKMASLGVMVAGVAHEISTPVGVGALAASSLQRRTSTLSQLFAQRRMTQSDLQEYLGDSQSQAGLVMSSLERVGRLIDKFRQVAVNQLPQAKTRFRVKTCLNDVLSSFGESLCPDRITVVVRCPQTLELESYAADWVSIFTNFVSNSLQHGFKGLEHGTIEIEIFQSQSQLCVVYCDDGHGLTPQSRERIFDPFFTTDMQSGMGLGMHLVYNLITQRLGGQVAVESQPERGVRFRIEVPNHPDEWSCA